ncbi:M24 family metallopeptidase [Natrialbaceae archaeon A-CW2]
MNKSQKKLDSVRKLMAQKNIDLAIFGTGPNLQYLTESDIDWRRFTDLGNVTTSFFVPLEGQPTLLAGPFAHTEKEMQFEVRNLEVFEEIDPVINKILTRTTNSPSRIAIDPYTNGSIILSINKHRGRAEIVSTDGMLDGMRAIKDSEEINHLRSVAELTDTVMREVVQEIEEGDTMNEINLKIETLGREYGASDISFPSTAGFCKSGKGKPDQIFNYEDDEGLEKGTSIAFDVGFVQSGYCSDWGRSFYFGNPPKHIEKAYSTLMQAVTETIDAIGKEVHKTNEIFPYIEQVCEREGYGEYLRNRHPDGVVGHQIGVEVHENPWLRPESNHELQDGMVLCIEPKLLSENHFYIRVEDMVYIKDGSAESLTQYDREQFGI